MMKVNEFIDTLTRIEKEPTKYLSGGWGHYIDGKWCFDCICLIKAVLWGFNFNKNKPRGGGAVYTSNGVPDIGENSMINQCKNVSSDFTNIKKGEMLWMDGHAGVYVGDGNVIEATAGWDTWKVIKSQIGKNGERTYNGKGGSRNWEKHGFLPYVDYTENEIVEPVEPKEEEPIEEPKFKVGDKVKPLKLVNYNGTPLVQYDKAYTIMEINGDRVVLGAPRGSKGKLEIWAAMNINDIEKIY